MAFENLFIRTKRSLGGIQLDSVLEEAHDNTIRLTQNPIESGVDVTDHAIVVPKKLSMRAVVTDSPLGLAAFALLVDSVTNLFGTSTNENATRSQQAYALLLALKERREPIVVTTRLVVYDNMVITRLAVVQDKDTSQAVFLNIELEQIIITESQIVDIPPSDLEEGTTREQASPPIDNGRQETIPVGDSTQTSVLQQIINLF
jgi:hypothetical protein